MHTPGAGSVPDSPSSPPSESPQPIDIQESLTPDRAGDRLETSMDSNPGDESAESEDRAERLAQIKAAIEAGDYETQDKLDAALSRLFEEISVEEDES